MRSALPVQMPMPEAGPLARRKITLLRRGLAALARAFAHESTKADEKLLKTAAARRPAHPCGQ